MKIFSFRNITFIFVLLVLFSQQGFSNTFPDFTQLAKDNASAVVNISTKQKNKKTPFQNHPFEIPGIPEGSPFKELLKRFLDDNLNGNTRGQKVRSLGSGFVFSADGYILTNNHVIDNAAEILVHFESRKTYPATVVGVDKGSDIAVLKIDANNLPTLKLGSSKELEVGEWVLAIGSPFGFDHTVTAGIVSAKGRNLPSENYVPFIQTDVAINPGNSGGPLFNLAGEVVGINSQIYSRTGGYMGLSFAIPIELAVNVSNQIINKGHVSRGYLGVLIQDVDVTLAKTFGLDSPRGALISKVLPGSPAAKAGLQLGDIILSFEGKTLLNSTQLPAMVGSTNIDSPITLIILRNKKEQRIKMMIGELPSNNSQIHTSKVPDLQKKKTLGLSFGTLSEKQRIDMGVAKGGLLVTSVAHGIARKAGIVKGDVLLRFNNIVLTSEADLSSALKGVQKGDSVAVLVQKKSAPVFVAFYMTE